LPIASDHNPSSERTEQSTATSKSTSGISKGRRTLPAQHALAQGLGIHLPASNAAPSPLPDKPATPRSTSPSKKPVSPELVRRVQAFGRGKASSISSSMGRPAVPSSRSAGDLIRLFDAEPQVDCPPTPSKLARPSSPIKDDRGRTKAPSALPNFRPPPPLRKDFSPAPSITSADSSSMLSVQQPLLGELLYAPTASSPWLSCRAALAGAELDLQYEIDGAAREERFDLTASRKVESVRIPPHHAHQDLGRAPLHMFQVIWRDPRREATRFGCHRGVDRVEWLTRMMCARISHNKAHR
jgi:hypothetical protein